MTAEKRISISPQDIIGIGFDCPHCHALFSVPVGKIDRVPTSCPNCNERWLSETQPSNSEHSDTVALKYVVDFLQHLQKRKCAASLRFEIGGDVRLDAKA